VGGFVNVWGRPLRLDLMITAIDNRAVYKMNRDG